VHVGIIDGVLELAASAASNTAMRRTTHIARGEPGWAVSQRRAIGNEPWVPSMLKPRLVNPREEY